MNILVLNTTILGVNPTDAGDAFHTSDQIIPKNVVAGATIVDATLPADFTPQKYQYVGGAVVPAPIPADQLAAAKADKNAQINTWRAAANKTFFTYSGKQIACDDLSRGDIDAVAGSISLTGSFPVGFPNAWKAMDNTYVPIPDIATFKAMYAAMTLQGTQNFGHSQSLKATVAAATTLDQINAVVW